MKGTGFTNDTKKPSKKKLSEYILFTKEERQSHVDLSTPCDLSGRATSRRLLGVTALLEFLNLTNDVPNRVGIAQCNHACKQDSTHGWCINPQHIYFGTATENISDIPAEQLTARAQKTLETKRENGTQQVGWGGDYDSQHPRCPHCELRMGLGHDDRYGNECDRRVGSWRWFVRELKEWNNERYATCPHCGTDITGSGNWRSKHFDNCDQREGSWRWFKRQLKELKQKRRKRQTRVLCERCGKQIALNRIRHHQQTVCRIQSEVHY